MFNLMGSVPVADNASSVASEDPQTNRKPQLRRLVPFATRCETNLSNEVDETYPQSMLLNSRISTTVRSNHLHGYCSILFLLALAVRLKKDNTRFFDGTIIPKKIVIVIQCHISLIGSVYRVHSLYGL